MRLLYIDHPEADYLAAQVYLGLCQVLGPEKVVDWPVKKSFHGETHRYPHVYETDPGYSPHQTWEMTGEGPVGTTFPFSWLPPQPMHKWTRESVIDHLSGFELVILASPRKWNTAALRELIATVGRDKLPPLVIVDGEDYTAVRWDLANEFRPRTYFKRDVVPNPDDVWPRDREAASPHVRVVPLPLAPVDIRSRIVDDMNAPIDVFLPGGGNTPGGVEQWCEAARRVSKSHVFGYGSHDFEEYVRTIARARIAVAVRGHSQDSLRSWEMLAVEGPLVAVQRHTLIRPYPFIDGEHVVEFGSPDELTAVLSKYLADEPLRARIAAAGHAHLRAHHTTQARARYLLHEAGLTC